MAKPRINLSDIFHGLCQNVYFQPPGGNKLEYPCIVYSLEDLEPRHANNLVYGIETLYSVQYITRDPEDPVIYSIAMLPLCTMSGTFSNDNIHHYQYRLYY